MKYVILLFFCGIMTVQCQSQKTMIPTIDNKSD